VKTAAALLAFAFITAALTFENLWPTLWIRPNAALSVESALAVLGIAWLARRGSLSRKTLTVLAAVFSILVLTRYAEVTTQALYGRPINLYWDVEHVPRVAAMLGTALSPLMLAAVGLLAVITLATLFLAVRFALERIAMATRHPGARRGLGLAAAAVIVVYGAGLASEAFDPRARFARPVTAAYAQQARLLYATLTDRESAAPGATAALDGSLGALANADVFLVFVESYGAATFTLDAHRAALVPARAALDGAVRETGRAAVSALMTSPTFGGASWLAHASVLAGRETRTPDAYNRLMNSGEDTLVHLFARHGYRTVALMPGLRQAWPEGARYGFDALYDAAALDYRGPAFGWWRIPDQYALARLDALEVERAAHRPLFVFFPTITSHAPFRPTPPYQPDWVRAGSAAPYDPTVPSIERTTGADWLDLGRAYGASIAYALTTLAGYLRHRTDRELIVVLVGDHQPPAGAAGPQPSWDVPVHVITRRGEVLDALRERGFVDGLEPVRASLGPLHELARLLLDAFSDPAAQSRVDIAGSRAARKVVQ
jgi:hypothetical protein